MKRLAIFCGALLLSACATAPSQIAAIYVMPGPYRDLNCEQLAAERARVSGLLDRAVHSQERARTWDTAGVLMVGLPVATMAGGNRRGEIADYRGQINAIDLVGREKSCPGAPLS